MPDQPAVVAGDTTITAAIKALASDDTATRWTAFSLLCQRGGGAVPELVAALRGDRERVQRDAVVILGLIGPPAADAIPDIVSAMGSDDRDTRNEFANALYRVDPSGDIVVPLLVDLIKRDRIKGNARCTAYQALWRYGPRSAEALPNCVDDMADDSASVRADALALFHHAGEARLRYVTHMAEGLAKATRDGAKSIYEASVYMLDEDAAPFVPYYVEQLKDPDPEVRQNALIMLARIKHGAKDAAPAVEKQLYANPILFEAQLQAPYTLAAITPEAPQMLWRAFESPLVFPMVKIWIAGALMRPNDRTHLLLPAFLQILDDEDADRRTTAARFIGACGTRGKDATDALLRRCDDDSESVRKYSLYALGNVMPATPQNIVKLAEMARERPQSEQLILIYVVGQLGLRGDDDTRAQAVQEITPYLKVEARRFQAVAMSQLVELGSRSPELLTVLRQELLRTGVGFGSAARDAIQTLGPDAQPLAGDLVRMLKDELAKDRDAIDFGGMDALDLVRALAWVEPTDPGVLKAMADAALADISCEDTVARALMHAGGHAAACENQLKHLALNGHDSATRSAAIKALDQIAGARTNGHGSDR